MRNFLGFLRRWQGFIIGLLVIAIIGIIGVAAAQPSQSQTQVYDRCLALGFQKECILPENSERAHQVVAAAASFTPPSDWACRRTWTYQSWTNDQEPQAWLQANGWGTINRQFGVSNEEWITSILSSTPDLGQGDLILLSYTTGGGFENLSPATIQALKTRVRDHDLKLVVETEFFGYGYSPKVNQFLRDLGVSIRRDDSKENVLFSSADRLYWWPDNEKWGYLNRGGSSTKGYAIATATANFLGGPFAVSVYQTRDNLVTMAEEDGIRVEGDTTNDDKLSWDGYYSYPESSDDSREHYARLYSCATNTGGVLQPAPPDPTATPTATRTATNTPTTMRTATATRTPAPGTPTATPIVTPTKPIGWTIWLPLVRREVQTTETPGPLPTPDGCLQLPLMLAPNMGIKSLDHAGLSKGAVFLDVSGCVNIPSGMTLRIAGDPTGAGQTWVDDQWIANINGGGNQRRDHSNGCRTLRWLDAINLSGTASGKNTFRFRLQDLCSAEFGTRSQIWLVAVQQ